jgi:DNA modification methylase
MKQEQLFDFDASRNAEIAPAHTTHSGGRGEPFHDWYPYLEGFSSEFVKHMLDRYMPGAKRIIEPFAGTGTTPVSLSGFGIDCGYCEVNPAMRIVISAKIAVGKLSQAEREVLKSQLLELSSALPARVRNAEQDQSLISDYASSFRESAFFSRETYRDLLSLRTVNDDIQQENPLLGAILCVCVMSKIVICSQLKRAGDVRYKTEKELAKGVPGIISEVARHLTVIANDCDHAPDLTGNIELLSSNAKDLGSHAAFQADGVITSPPYLNGTNYFRNTKLELWYSRFLSEKHALRNFRNEAITSGINDVAKTKGKIFVNDKVRKLAEQLEANAYDARIPRMVAGYFEDMSKVIAALATCCKPGGVLCIDIGDSRYGGIHVPTHDMLVDIGENLGLQHVETVRLRTRISKDQTRLSQSLVILNKI